MTDIFTCSFCGNETELEKLDPLSGDEWMCWGCYDQMKAKENEQKK